TTQRQAYDLLADGFGPGFNGPFTVVADLGGATDPTAAVAELRAALVAEPGVVSVGQPALNETADTAVISVTPSTGPSDAATEDLVKRLRHDVAPFVEATTGAEVLVTGSTAAN